MERETTADDHIQFSVSISTDRDQFLRRTCPSCGRDFKTQIAPADLQWTLSSYCRRMGLEIGAQQGDQGSTNRIRCPYCGHEDESSQMLTEETVEYLKRIVYREYALPQISKAFSGIEGSLGGGSHCGGLISMSIEFKHSRSLLPARPIHGPEPADLKIVEFLCCGKKIKVSENWTDVRVCSFCGTEIVLI